MSKIKELGRVENEAKIKQMTPDSVQKLRKGKSSPVLLDLKSWMVKQHSEMLPKSLTGNALAYTLAL